MRKLLALVLTALSVGPPAFAQDDDASWKQLEGMRSGTKIHLTLKEGAEIEGLLVEARADAITLDSTRLLKGSFSSPAGTRLGERLTFSRGDVVHLVAPKAKGTGMSPGRKIAIAGIAAGVIFLLSPAGQCITSSTGC
jgi:hypothetical protein